MRPLKLTMTAFGPYKDQEVIDFRELQEHRLFVVSGNTGAGKTSIFDAICFALYGAASGEDRSDSRMLRSHFADDEVHTSVDFEFELRGREYRVFRQLAHVKAGNKSATGDRHELYAVTGGKEAPLIDRFTVSQVDQKIRELIGLDKDQFSQIVMLPQGEFRKLLTSDTDNKEEILRRIFKTGLYKVVADQLNEKRKQMERICRELENIREFHIGNVKGSLADREGSDLARVFAQPQYNTFQVLEALERELVYFSGEIGQEDKRLQAASARQKELTELFHLAQTVNGQFDLLGQKEAARAALEAGAEENTRRESRLSLADKAVHLQAYELRVKEQTEECSKAAKLQEDAARELAEAGAALEAAAGLYEREESKAGQREQSVLELARLQSFLPNVREIERKRERVAGLKAEATALAGQLKQLEEAYAAGQSERDKLAAQVKQLEERVAHLPEQTERLNLFREQAVVIRDYLALTQKIEREHAEESKHQAACEQAEQAYSLMESRWFEGQAGVLAGHLHDGEACPVCGSTHHPYIAVLPEHVPAKEELDAERQRKNAAEKLYLEAKATLAATRQQAEEKLAQVQEHGFSTDGLPGRYQSLTETGKALADEVKRLKEEHAGLAQLKLSFEQLESKLAEELKHKELLANRVNEQNTVYATEHALYEQALAAIPEELRHLPELERQIGAAELLKKQLDEAWKLAQAQYKAGSERKVKAAADMSNAENRKREAEANLERVLQAFQEQLEQAGFAGEAVYAAAKMPEADRAELKKQIEAYYASLAAVRQQIAELQAALAGKQRHDLEGMRQRLGELEQQIESIRSRHLQLSSDFARGTELKANIETAEQKVKEAEAHYQQVKHLYDVVRGENGRKISFERYLQVEFLEQIIVAANQRLRQLSAGQYYLVRSDRLEKRGKQSGLGFDIYDNYTGQLRDVKTLSGGEKFNASLCLALGMADVIQSYEGGVSLETMFIDEGFGSLDEEALNKAIDTLIDLQQSGRMIGVISHVQELKQSVPAVLEVKKTKEGHSYTQFVVQ